MSTTGSRPSRAAPPPATVHGNDWTLLEPVAAGEATSSASVVVDRAASPGAAAASAAALDVLAGGPALEVLDAAAAPEPSGDVVVLLGPGSILPPSALHAHLRHHENVADVVSLAPARRIEPAGLDPEALATAAAAGGEALAGTLEPRRLGGDDDGFGLALDLTAALTEGPGGLVCAAGLGVLAVRRATLTAAGGLGDPALAGPLRRLDLVHRLACHGAVFVPEPAGAAWTAAGEEEAELAMAIARAAIDRRTLELERPGAAALVPAEPFRRVASSRRLRRPSVIVNVDAGGHSAEESLAAIAPVLAGHHGDLELRVQMPDSDPARPAITAAIAADPRASIAPASTEGRCESPFQILMPALTLPDPRTIADLHRLLVSEGAGALHVTIPGAPPDEVMIEALQTAALERSRRVAAATGEPAEAVLGRLFGERWLSGVEVSVRRNGVEEPHVTEHGPLAAATDPDHERTQHLRFRDRADDLGARAGEQEAAIVSERLRARRERLRAERLERRLAGSS